VVIDFEAHWDMDCETMSDRIAIDLCGTLGEGGFDYKGDPKHTIEKTLKAVKHSGKKEGKVDISTCQNIFMSPHLSALRAILICVYVGRHSTV
jgi:hypothetical protein